MDLKLALIAILLAAAVVVSGCCCCVIPSHRGYSRVPCLIVDRAHSMVRVTATVIPGPVSATPTPTK